MRQFIIAASAIMIATSALASTSLADDTYASSYSLPREATLSGTVERIINPQQFTLRANHKVVVVNIATEHSPILNEGDNITVMGTHTGNNASIDAHTVYLNQRANT